MNRFRLHSWCGVGLAAFAVIACSGACGGASTPSDVLGPEPAATVPREFPPFPPGAVPPPSAELAGLLARGLPEPDRAAAIRVLVDEILPWDLRDLPGDPRAAPSPRAIARAAYDTLANQLGEVAPERRLSRLATMACTRRGGRITGHATALAVARYVVDHGRPRSNLVVGYLDEARTYLAMSPDQLQAEAARVERDLAAFERDAQPDTDCAERQRASLVHARHALIAVRTGSFEAADGPLYVFLRNAGANPRRLEPR
jgi:hypothetical protein